MQLREEFGNLKPETVTAIFYAAATKNRITRNEIAQTSLFSVATVGKVADILVSLKILRQSYSLSSVPGRRSRVLSVSNKRLIAVYDLSTPNFTLLICDLTLNIIDKFVYYTNPDYFHDENLHFFFEKSFRYLSARMKPSFCCGCAILTPGHYCEHLDRIHSPYAPMLSDIGLRAAFEKISPDAAHYTISDACESFARAVYSTIEQGQCILCIFINKTYIRSCFCANDSGELRLQMCNFGKIGAGRGRSLYECIEKSINIEEILSALIAAIFDIVAAVSVDGIVLTGDLFSNMDSFAELIHERLDQLCLEHDITCPNIEFRDAVSTAAYGVADRIRANWLKKIISKD